MRLLAQEQRILAALELSALKDMHEVRKETGFRDHKIRYRLDRMIQRGMIEFHPFINLYPLGYVDYAFYFSLASEKETLKQKPLAELIESPHVTWIASMGGDYQYGVAMCAQHHHEVVQFWDTVTKRYPGAIFQKVLSLRVSLSLFQRKYLEGARSSFKADQKRFFTLAMGSLRECQCILDLAYTNDIPVKHTADLLGAHLYKLINS
jgi:hypothetical protein